MRKIFLTLIATLTVIGSTTAIQNRWRLPKTDSSLENITFRKVPGRGIGHAIFDPPSAGAWDDWVTCPTIVYDGKLYRMWYSSQYESKAGPRGIGLATSVDGINWKRENGGHLVFTVRTKGNFDSAQILSPEVHFDGHNYLMWYTGIDGSKNSTGLELERIGLAVSEDGIHWTRANSGKPVLELGPSGSNDDVQVAYPSIIKEEKYYRMWYSAYAVASNHTIVAARSVDGVHWEREKGGKSVTGLSPSIAYAPGVTRWRGHYLMFYTGWGTKSTAWGIYAAVSDDGLNWQMINRGETFVPFGESNDFDRDNMSHPFALTLGDRLLVWYTGFNRGPSHNDPLLFRMGLAKTK